MRISDWSSDVCSSDLMTEKGLAVVADAERGLDHGAWVPLSLIYPDADVPVVQLSIASHASPEWHYALGQALVPLRDEGVLIVGSGSITHNLRALFSARLPIDAPAPAWVSDFTRSEEHTSELQSLMRNSYAVFCLKKKN